ncbi:MAG: phasin family protein [Actinomycetota bacterium]|nr:phasin family protein [Actinomycetota bacterium]
MADKDDVFKRYLEAGLSFFEMTQQRAEAALKDLAGSGESAKGQAQKAVDWVKERSRQGTDELRELVGNEIRSQMDTMGLATKDDLARLEARLAALEAGAGSAEPTKTAGSRKAAGITKAATTQKANKRTATTNVPAMKKAARPAATRGIVPPVAGPGSAPDVGAAPEEKA